MVLRNNKEKFDNYGFVTWDEKSEHTSEITVNHNVAESTGKTKWWRQLFKKHEKSSEKHYNERKDLKKSNTAKNQKLKKEKASQVITHTTRNNTNEVVKNYCTFEELGTKKLTQKGDNSLPEKVVPGRNFQTQEENLSRFLKNNKEFFNESLLYDKSLNSDVNVKGVKQLNSSKNCNLRNDAVKKPQQRKVLIHIRTKEEVEIENGVPKWQRRPNSKNEGMEFETKNFCFSNSSSAFHRPKRSTVGDFSQLYKSSSTSDGSFSSLFKLKNTINSESELADNFKTKKKSLHRSYKDKKGSLKKLNLIQFERKKSWEESPNSSHKNGRFFAITGITTTTDYEFLEYMNRKNKKQQLMLKHPEIKSIPIKGLAKCLNEAKKYNKLVKTNDTASSFLQTDIKNKQSVARLNLNDMSSTHIPEKNQGLDESKKWYSETDLSTLYVSSLKMSSKAFDKLAKIKGQETEHFLNISKNKKKIDSEDFLRRIRTKLDEIENLKNKPINQDYFTGASTLLMNIEDKSTSCHDFRNKINMRIRNNSGSKCKNSTRKNISHSSNADCFATTGRQYTKNKFEKQKLSKSISLLDERILNKDNLLQSQIKSRTASPCTQKKDLPLSFRKNPLLYSKKVCSTSKLKDPIINTMLDAMQKVNEKYSSGNYTKSASKTCLSGKTQETKRKCIEAQDFLSWDCDETDL